MWQEPKTDWKVQYNENGKYIGDYFNAVDYNRIKNNIAVLRGLALEVYSDFPYSEMSDDKTYTDYPYADELNVIEDNLDSILKNTYEICQNEKNTYYANQAIFTPDDLNRIERACLKLYLMLNVQIVNRLQIAFRLGAMKSPIKSNIELSTRIPIHLPKGE